MRQSVEIPGEALQQRHGIAHRRDDSRLQRLAAGEHGVRKIRIAGVRVELERLRYGKLFEKIVTGQREEDKPELLLQTEVRRNLRRKNIHNFCSLKIIAV